jgi:3-hydroxyisobutyrate dehydrogenase-like beta-hydroxyacid dehydrogenase
MTELPRIGFIGLGYMGHGMAENIRRRGFPLSVMAHRKRGAVEELVRSGAEEVQTPAEMAARSDIVILCVTGARQVDELVRGANGLAAAARPGLVIVDCTTSDPATLLQLSADYKNLEIEFVDAPLGRSPEEAWQGALSTMVGCETDVLDRIRPVLSAFATTIQHVGKLGNGHRLKLVNNFVSLGFAAIYSEALVLALKAGLTVETYDSLIRSSRMHCGFYDTFIGWALHGDANSHRFALDTALHTISDVTAFAGSVDLKSKLVLGISEIFGQAVAAGDGEAMLAELPRSVAKANELDLTPLTTMRLGANK